MKNKAEASLYTREPPSLEARNNTGDGSAQNRPLYYSPLLFRENQV